MTARAFAVSPPLNMMDGGVWLVGPRMADKLMAMSVMSVKEKYESKVSATYFGASSCLRLFMKCIDVLYLLRIVPHSKVFQRASRDLITEAQFVPACKVDLRMQRRGRFEVDLTSVIWGVFKGWAFL